MYKALGLNVPEVYYHRPHLKDIPILYVTCLKDAIDLGEFFINNNDHHKDKNDEMIQKIRGNFLKYALISEFDLGGPVYTSYMTTEQILEQERSDIKLVNLMVKDDQIYSITTGALFYDATGFKKKSDLFNDYKPELLFGKGDLQFYTLLKYIFEEPSICNNIFALIYTGRYNNNNETPSSAIINKPIDWFEGITSKELITQVKQFATEAEQIKTNLNILIKKKFITQKTFKMIEKGIECIVKAAKFSFQDVKILTEVELGKQDTVDSMDLTVATVNAFEGGRQNENFSAYLQKISQEQKPDFIFLQEAPVKNHSSIVNLKNYHIVNFNDKLIVPISNEKITFKFEKMMTLRRLNSKWDWESSEPVYTNRVTGCRTYRVSTIDTIVHTVFKKKITIANIHLCGGTFNEIHHCKTTTQLDNLIQIKNDMLEYIIDSNTNIILGDFNSDYLAFIHPEDQTKLEYLINTAKCTKEMAQSWNSVPFKLLQDKKYTHVNIGDIKTSQYGPQTDNVWYNKNIVQYNGHNILEALKTNASDHQGISVNFHVSMVSSTITLYVEYKGIQQQITLLTDQYNEEHLKLYIYNLINIAFENKLPIHLLFGNKLIFQHQNGINWNNSDWKIENVHNYTGIIKLVENNS